MTVPAGSQWILTAEEYAALATFKGTSEEEELSQRYQATGLVQSLGMRLKLPQTTIATAQVLLHRFYIRSSFRHFPAVDLAPALIFLAAKVEEHPRRLADVLAAHEGKLDEGRLQALERIILTTVCFDVAVSHPYRWVLRMVRGIGGGGGGGGEGGGEVPDELVQAAWIVVNDSFRTPLCVRFEARPIAAAAIWYAAEKRGLDLAKLAGETAINADSIFECPRTTVTGNNSGCVGSPSPWLCRYCCHSEESVQRRIQW